MAADRERSAVREASRPSVDWEAAFAYYASLAPGERSYAAVGSRFGVSTRTVQTHGRLEGWKQRLRTIRAEVAAATNQVLVERQTEEALKIVRLIEASFVAYADKLRRGEVRMSPADLERLYKLQHTLVEELEQRQPAEPRENREHERTVEHTAAVIDALSRSGALATLGLTTIPDTREDGDD